MVKVMFFNTKQLLAACVFLILLSADAAFAEKKSGGRSFGGQSQNSVRGQISGGQLAGRSMGHAGNAGTLTVPGNAGNAGRQLGGFNSIKVKPSNGHMLNSNLGNAVVERTKTPGTIGINLPGTIKPGTIKPGTFKPMPGTFPTFPPIVGQGPTKPIHPNWPQGPIGPIGPIGPKPPVTPPINPNPPGGHHGGHGGYGGGCHNNWNLWVNHIGCWVRCPIVVRPCPLPVCDYSTGICTTVVIQPVIQTLPHVYAAGEVDLAVREVRILKAADAVSGPVYQVFVTNNGPSALTVDARVALFGVGDSAPDENTPRVLQNFSGLLVGETAVVEVQMPVAANQFPYLLVAVEVPEGVRDTDESNNLAQGEVARLPLAVASR